ncbi:mCG146092, partial [Mus musculus]
TGSCYLGKSVRSFLSGPEDCLGIELSFMLVPGTCSAHLTYRSPGSCCPASAFDHLPCLPALGASSSSLPSFSSTSRLL